jgi:hypothetical protein
MRMLLQFRYVKGSVRLFRMSHTLGMFALQGGIPTEAYFSQMKSASKRMAHIGRNRILAFKSPIPKVA